MSWEAGKDRLIIARHTHKSLQSPAQVDLGGCSINACVDATHPRVVQAVSTGIDLIVVAADMSKSRSQPTPPRSMPVREHGRTNDKDSKAHRKV